jgi:predicted alpha/beta-hydrolase family hydrolase
MPEQIRVEVGPDRSVTATIYPGTAQDRAGVTLILGHGAGAGQASGFMVNFAAELAARGIDVVTFNFVYMENGRRLPDPKDRLEACYRAVIDAVCGHAKIGSNKLAIGGKSMGGRIASQVAAADPAGLAGLVLLGYPLHPPGRPEQLRTRHLPDIRVPLLIVQGERDAFGTPEELRPVLRTLKAPAELYVIEAGDHSFNVPKSAGTPQAQVHARVLDEIERWLRATIGAKPRR